MEIEVKDVDLGSAVKKRFDELGLKKVQLAKILDIPQQHVNRLFMRDSMETAKLIKVCYALDFNFFSLFCAFAKKEKHDKRESEKISAMEKQLEVASKQREIDKLKIESLNEQISVYRDQIEILKGSLKDKDVIIEMLRENQ